MPFLAPIGAAIGGALTGAIGFLTGGTLLSKIVIAGLSIAARILFNGNKTPDAPPAQASQLETRYGEDQPRTVLFGKVGTAGHHVYRNAYGPGNRIIQDVIVLSHFRINGVTRVRYEGEWHTLTGASDEFRGNRIAGIEAEVWVKVYHGTMAQVADAALVTYSNPPGRWTENHRGAGVAYAVVTSVLDREHLPSPWDAFFEVEGAPLYDWRRDTTAGGSGSHRWNDQSTWEYGSGIGTNPVLMMYALERGIFQGSELMVGKQVLSGNLPLAEWTIAANICDEIVGTTRRYQASCIVSSGSGSTHSANMEPILAACAGSWIELVGQEYPLVGANQASVATFTDVDIPSGEAFRFSAKRERAELVNTVAGSFIHEGSFYQSVPFSTRIDTAALAADRERLAVSIPFSAVTVPECVDRLADIAIRASRYQGSADLVLRPKFLGLKPGQWITWNSARHGTRVMQVISKQLGALAANGARNVYLALQEVGAGVFDPTAYVTVPPDGIGRGEPDFLSELDNFQVSPFTVENEDGKRYPAIRSTWNDINDPTVIGIDFQWRPKAQPEALQEDDRKSDRTDAILSNGVISSTPFQVRTKLVTHPYRVVPWSVWHEVMTPDAQFNDISVFLANLQNDLRDYLQDRQREHDALVAEWQNVSALIAARNAADVTDRRMVEMSVTSLDNGLTAQITALQNLSGTVTMQGDSITALGEALTLAQAEIEGTISTAIGQLQAEVTLIDGQLSAVATTANAAIAMSEAGTASGLMQIRSVSGPGGVGVRLLFEGRATTSEGYSFAGAYLEVTPAGSRWAFNSNEFIITDVSGNVQFAPFAVINGEVVMMVARINELIGGLYRSDDNSVRFDLNEGSLEMFF